jgi:hypothetical protein
MQVIVVKVRLVRAFCLMLVFVLAAAPAIETAHHGPGALVAEADHHAHGPSHDHDHDHGGAPHDSSDHDHVSIALLSGQGAEVHAAPSHQELFGSVVAASSPPDGPRRPPRPTMI